MDCDLEARLREARVARLATCDPEGRPHVIPVCFAFDGQAFYTALDHKPKQVPLDRLARVRNIRANPHVALLVDEYSEDWTRLWYVLVRGAAGILASGQEHAEALRLLRAKYPQYASDLLTADAPVIRIVPVKIAFWKGGSA